MLISPTAAYPFACSKKILAFLSNLFFAVLQIDLKDFRTAWSCASYVTAVTFFPLFSFLTFPINIDSAPFFSEAINFLAFS